MNLIKKGRSGNERRITKSHASFPLRDSQSILVISDRRVNADRRSDGLDVTETDISKDEFNKFFASYQGNE